MSELTLCRRGQFAGGEASHDSGQPDVLPRRGRASRRRRARARRPAHGLRSDHALFPQPQGINRHTPSHHASSVVLLCRLHRPLVTTHASVATGTPHDAVLS